MPTRRDGILEAILDLLDAGGKPAGVVVERFKLTDSPAKRRIALYWVGTTFDRNNDSKHGSVQENRTVVRLLLQSVVAEGQAPDQATDDLEVWAITQLMQDPTLGGLALDLEPQQAVLDGESFQAPKVRAYLDFLVTFDTDLADPSVLPGETSL